MPRRPAPAEVAVRAAGGGGDGVRVRRALVIGVERYLRPTKRLPTCAQDALRVARVLAARGYRVKALHDGPGSTARPTRAAVLAAVKALARAADADDLVVVYAACHGTLLDERPYLMLADTPARAIATRGLALSELLTRLRGGPRWAAIFLDVCHMGLGLDPTTAEAAADADERDGGFALLAASTSEDIAQDTRTAGIFSQHLVEGLVGGAADPSGAVRLSALARHVQDGVARWREGREGKLKTSTQAPVLRLEVADLELAPPHAYRLLEQQPAKVGCASFSPSGKLLATGCDDGSVRLWDPATGAAVRAPMKHDATVVGLTFSPDGRRLWSVDEHGGLARWDVARAAAIEPAPPPLGTSVSRPAWSLRGEGHVLAAFVDIDMSAITPQTAGLDEAALRDLLRMRHGFILRDARGTRRFMRRGHVPMAAVYARAAGAFYSGGAEGSLLRWDLRTGRAERLGRHEGPLWAIALSPDGRRLAAGGSDEGRTAGLVNEARIWDLASRAAVPLPGHRAPVTSIAFRPDGARVATACVDGLVRVWHAASGQLLRELTTEVDGRAHRAEAWSLAYAPDGRRLAVGYADGRGALFDVTEAP